MAKLNTQPNLGETDELYARLLAAHNGLSPEQSAGLNARLILLLANHIGDRQVLDEALQLAQKVAPAS